MAARALEITLVQGQGRCRDTIALSIPPALRVTSLRARTLRFRCWGCEGQDGLVPRQHVVERGYEGLVARDSASPYCGGRTLARHKLKVPHYREGARGWTRSPEIAADTRAGLR